MGKLASELYFKKSQRLAYSLTKAFDKNPDQSPHFTTNIKALASVEIPPRLLTLVGQYFYYSFWIKLHQHNVGFCWVFCLFAFSGGREQRDGDLEWLGGSFWLAYFGFVQCQFPRDKGNLLVWVSFSHQWPAF